MGSVPLIRSAENNGEFKVSDEELACFIEQTLVESVEGKG